ncbi:MAG: hypothetical protein [Microviridae sp.]|nr:MAG: hypothetical protein [Microviridae sp.]
MKASEQKAKFRLSTNYTMTKADMEHPSGKSLTVPDDTYTVQEMLERHARGLPLAGRDGIYIDDSDIEDHDLEEFNRGDITDRHEMAEAAGQVVREEETKKKKAETAKKEKDRAEWTEWKKDKAKKASEPPESQKVPEKSDTK